MSSVSFDHLKVHSRQTKTKGKAKIFFDVCHLFFDLVRIRPRFRFMWIGPVCKRALTLTLSFVSHVVGRDRELLAQTFTLWFQELVTVDVKSARKKKFHVLYCDSWFASFHSWKMLPLSMGALLNLQVVQDSPPAWPQEAYRPRPPPPKVSKMFVQNFVHFLSKTFGQNFCPKLLSKTFGQNFWPKLLSKTWGGRGQGGGGGAGVGGGARAGVRVGGGAPTLPMHCGIGPPPLWTDTQ